LSRHLHFDCYAGAAGDMILAALLDVGLSPEALREALGQLAIGDYALRHERVTRAGIAGTLVCVEEAASAHGHGKHHHHRHLRDMLAVLEPLPERPRTRARAVLELLADAEGKVHGRSRDAVHFHEISGIDTLVDVAGACLGLELLGVQTVTCSPLTVGSGTITCAHGTLPLPAPATLEILAQRQIPYTQIDSGQELLTPTGAALLAVLCESFGPCPPLVPERIGYGAGGRDLEARPNVLRAVLGAPSAEDATHDTVVEFRTAIDDMTPEEIAYLLEKCLAAGALDAYAVPAIMKKGRPGVELTVLAAPAKAPALECCLFLESRTFGLRVQLVPRAILAREFLTVQVQGRDVRVKLGRYEQRIVTVQPEYEDCRQVAMAAQLPLGAVFSRARQEAEAQLGRAP